MKVILINGSPHKNGCTYTALSEIAGELNKVSSQYWNQVHGSNPEQVKQDLEGMQTMRRLGANMAWLLKCIEAGKKAGVKIPEAEPWQRTDFMR